ncbi:hypothetical protein TBLA_0B04330 [Henningerozyma blattae CBS 6284]|uniref:Uncharacterized protein n=1 Tax=Henningerozyma blattae (strain ATCC 34711 / CBS 6284 / DSM 70876 / NBRC 10599 / NRRL Y-10934 / UCD 77-7) TaxID=1071380 RepID=I2GYR8_HENB6|nr:hypothetical protein TBLA_0B04330 [Tetrapisispora blattae CBS 6284]CCH59270.1 hypothetical protein TBLA_0B04330 [Tetrapisispora blattae CBS 6284]
MGIPEVTEAISAQDVNEDSFTKLNGRKNQSVTKPVTVDSETGEILVRRATGKARVRRGQTEEEYNEQLRQYFTEENGPTRTEPNFMDNVNDFDEKLDTMDLSIKQNRLRLQAYPQRAYYRRNYSICKDLCSKLILKVKDIPKIQRELEELEYMQNQCMLRLSKE